MEAARSLAVSAAPPALAGEVARIGPNAVIQLAVALRARIGEEDARQVFAAAGVLPLLDELPEEMVLETTAAALYDALFAVLPHHALTVAEESGTRTANYILANRIPWVAQQLLKTLPATLAGPLLLNAIARNAWTFAGSGQVATESCGRRFAVEIADNPMAMPGCVWHQAVFRRLFAVLVSPQVSVSHPSCCDDGATLCRFEITAA